MIAEIIITTMCLAANGIPPKVFKSTHVFKVPMVCLAKTPCGRDPGTCKVYSDGGYSSYDGCNWTTCGGTFGGCMTTAVYCAPPPWWEENNTWTITFTGEGGVGVITEW